MDAEQCGEAVADKFSDSDPEQASKGWSDDSSSSDFGIRFDGEDSFEDKLRYAKYRCREVAKCARRNAERELKQHCMFDEVDFTDGDENGASKGFILKARELQEGAESSKLEALNCYKTKKEIFLNYLAESINRVDRSDLQFICKEGDMVYASKFFCTGRSAMLDAMLVGGMSEAASSVIRVPEIYSQTLLAILEFLYTGNVKWHLPRSWRMKFEVIDAAHFFMLKHIAAIIEGSMLKKIKNAQKAAKLLSMAMPFNFVRSGDEYVSLSVLTNLFRWNWMEKECAPNLSEVSIDFILRQTKQGSIKEKSHKRPALYEYLRFRGV